MNRKKGILYGNRPGKKTPSVQEVQGKNMTKAIGDHFAGPINSKVKKSPLETYGEAQAVYELGDNPAPAAIVDDGKIPYWDDENAAINRMPYESYRRGKDGVVTAIPHSPASGVGNAADQKEVPFKYRTPEQHAEYNKLMDARNAGYFNRRARRADFNSMFSFLKKK